MLRLGVTGTDTGVGKTVVATALIARLRHAGYRVAAMKPIETGVSEGDRSSDAARLLVAAGAGDPLTAVSPVRFAEPVAPLVAAERAGQPIAIERLDAAVERLATGRDAIVVEGAGGLLVPITDGIGFDTLFHRWHLDLIVVAANRLGAVNHTLLTIRAADAAGLRVRAIVLNETHEATTDVAEQTNLAVLRRLLPTHQVLSFPYVEPPHDPDLLADRLAWDP